MGAIWLVFLMFPLTSAFTVETSWVWRALAITAILAFAAIYFYGFIRIGRTETWADVNHFGLRFCNKCSVLFYDGYESKGRCTAGDEHFAQGYDFVLPHLGP